MSRRGKRKTVAKNIYDDDTGRSIAFRVNGRKKELRHPPGTSIKTLRRAMETYLRKKRGSGRSDAIRGTLSAAVDAWEPQEQHLVSWKERRAELRAWVDLYGDMQMTRINGEHIRKAIVFWMATPHGKAKRIATPKTVRNRLWSLQHLYRLDDPKAETPVDDITPPAKVRHVINPTPVSTILTVYANLLEWERINRLRDSKTRARFMVRASTGRRPCEIKRAQPEDVDLERRTWRVRDAKGGWSEGLYLNDDMLAAWQLFAECNAWGYFNTASQANVLRAAGWPSERDAQGKFKSRPYNMRHSVGIALGELGHDLSDIGGMLGQTDINTTRSHYVPILNSRMQRMSVTLAGRLGGWKTETA